MSAVGEAVEGVDQMIFRVRGKDVSGRSAIEVVRALERDDSEYYHDGGQFVSTFFGLLID